MSPKECGALTPKIESDKNLLSKIIDLSRSKIASLGIAGAIAYNSAKATIAGGTAFSLTDGETSEKLIVGGIAASLAILLSASFWIAMGVIATRVGSRRIFRKNHD